MIDWMFITLLIIALLFVLLTIITDYGIFWNVIFILTSIVIFFVLAAAIHEIEVPYTIYNATSGNIETGFHEIHNIQNTYLSYLFFMFAVIMMIYFVAYIYTDAIKKRWMR